MQERIAEYVATLKVKSIPDYETPARECSAYFDGRGIDMPNANDWEAFKEYYRKKYRREKGKDISPLTLQQNYVARGKAFYKWCASQDNPEQTATLFEEGKTEASPPPEPEAEKPRPTEASRPPAPDEEAVNTCERKEAETIEEQRQPDTSGSETAEKAVRTSLLIDAKTYKLLALFAALEDKTMTEILIAGARLYIAEHSQEAEILQGVIDARSK